MHALQAYTLTFTHSQRHYVLCNYKRKPGCHETRNKQAIHTMNTEESFQYKNRLVKN